MPASGRGANLVPRTPLRTPLPPNPTVRPAQPPSRPVTASTSATFSPHVSQHPFAAALSQAAQHVAQARAKLPAPAPAAHPDIPRLPNPTPVQTHAALQLIHQSAVKAVGPNPTPARVAAYQHELHSDPRNAEYVRTIQHYTAAAENHLAQQAVRAAGLVTQHAASGLRAKPLTPLETLLASANTQTNELAERSRNAAIARGEADAPKVRDTLNLPGATINLTPLLSAITHVHLAPKGVVGNVINEAIDLPGQSFLSGALTGQAARHAIEGKPAELEGLGKSLLSQIEHPVRTFKEAPLSTALIFAGGEGAAGKLLGDAGRGLGRLAEGESGLSRAAESIPRELRYTPPAPNLAAKVGRAFSTERPDLRLYGKEALTGRTYNADPIRKAAQVAYEKALTKLPGDLRQSSPFQAEGWRLRRNMVGGTLKPGAVDYIRAGGERTRRVMVKGDVARVDALKPAHGAAAVPLIVQRVIRTPATLAIDLGKEIGKLKEAIPALKGSAVAAAKANLHAAEALVADRHFMADPSEAFEAARKIIDIQRPHTAGKLASGTLDEEQLRASLFPYAQAHMGARYFSTADHAAAESAARASGDPALAQLVSGRDANGVVHAGMRHANGEFLPNEEILHHMEAHGVEPPGFVSHRTGVAGRSSYYKSTLRQPTLERFNRTGASFAKGTADQSWEALRGTIARQASERAQAEVRARELNRLAIGPTYATAREAQAAADNFHATRAGAPIEKLGRLQAVHLGSGKIIEKGNVAPVAAARDVLRQFGLEEHTTPQVDEQGHFALIPEQVAKRLQAHDDALRTNSDLGRAMQLYQQAFRRAKLNTSTRHIAGVMQEQGIRLGTEQVAPAITLEGRVARSLRLEGATIGGRAGRAGATFERNLRALAEVDKNGHLADSNGPLGASFRELEGALGRHGGVASASRANDVVRQGDQFAQSSALGYVLHGSEAAAKTKLGDAIAKPWRAYRATIEGGLSKVEHATYNPMLGKALKDSGFISSYRQVLKAQDDAVQALIREKLTPQMADSLARRVDDMMGNWTHQTPAVRTLIGKYAPFGLWWLNSMRWLYRLPVTHPVKAGILAAMYNATREARNAKGQGYDARSPVPAFLSGSIDTTLPGVGPVQLEPSYYSPGGTLGPEAFHTAVEQFLPALQGIASAAQGVNPLSGEKLTDSEKKALGPVQIGSNVLAEATAGPVPFATQLQQLAQRGGKPYGTANWITDALHEVGLGPSQIKPGTQRPLTSVLGKILSPVRFAYSKTGTGTGYSGPSSAAQPAESVYDRRLQRALQRAKDAESESVYDRRLQRALERPTR